MSFLRVSLRRLRGSIEQGFGATCDDGTVSLTEVVEGRAGVVVGGGEPVGETVRMACLEKALCEKTSLRFSAGLFEAVSQLVMQAEWAGVSSGLCSRGAKRALSHETQDAERTRRLAAAAALLTRRDSGRGHIPVAERLFGAVSGLAENPLWEETEEIEFADLHLAMGAEDVLPYPVWLLGIDGFLRTGKRLSVTLPQVEGRPALERALKPLYDALYRRHELPIELSTQAWTSNAAQRDEVWEQFVGSLFGPKGQAQGAPLELAERVTCCEAQNPQAEAEAIAAKVLKLCAEGISSDEIAVVAETPEQRHRLFATFQRAGIPTTFAKRGGRGLWGNDALPLPPPWTLLDLLFEVVALGLPKEGLAQLLGSRYLRFPGPLSDAPWLVVQALRASGVRKLHEFSPNSNAKADLWGDVLETERGRQTARLESWLANQSVRSVPHGAEVVPHLRGVARELGSLPQMAPLVEHCRALARLLTRLGFFSACEMDHAVAFGEDSFSSELGMSLLRAQEHDRAAGALVRYALETIPGALARLPFAHAPWSLSEFATLVRVLGTRLWSETLVPSFPSAVRLCNLSDVAMDGASHMFLTGLVEGAFPQVRLENPLLLDEDMRFLERMAGRELFAKTSEQNDAAPLRLVCALAQAKHVCVSWPRADLEGRPLLRSPFVEEIRFAAGLQDEGIAKESDLGGLLTTAELWQRAVQEPAFLQVAKKYDKRRAARLETLGNIEACRRRFFAEGGKDRGAERGHPFVGRLLDRRLVDALLPHLPGSPQHPLSVSVLEDYARCPYRFFVRRVLRVRKTLENGEELDLLATGRLHHEVLEAFYKDRQNENRLPVRADEDDRSALDRVIAKVVAGFAQREHIGHPALLQVRVRRLRADVWRLVHNEATGFPEKDCVPTLFEWNFGPLAIASSDEDPHAVALHIRGVIDRIDVGPGKVLVLDYKTGGLAHYKELIRKELLSTSFQLPLYVAALRADPSFDAEKGNSAMTARYYSLKDGKVGEPISDPDMTSLDLDVRRRKPDGNVAEVVYRLWKQLCDGDFVVSPKTCEGCGLESVCRVQIEPSEAETETESSTESSTESIGSSVEEWGGP